MQEAPTFHLTFYWDPPNILKRPTTHFWVCQSSTSTVKQKTLDQGIWVETGYNILSVSTAKCTDNLVDIREKRKFKQKYNQLTPFHHLELTPVPSRWSVSQRQGTEMGGVEMVQSHWNSSHEWLRGWWEGKSSQELQNLSATKTCPETKVMAITNRPNASCLGTAKPRPGTDLFQRIQRHCWKTAEICNEN